MKAMDEELCLTRAELLQSRDREKTAVEDFLKSREFVDLMEVHDRSRHPVSFTHGWKEALDSVLIPYPSAFAREEFPCPLAPIPSNHCIFSWQGFFMV